MGDLARIGARFVYDSVCRDARIRLMVGPIAGYDRPVDRAARHFARVQRHVEKIGCSIGQRPNTSRHESFNWVRPCCSPSRFNVNPPRWCVAVDIPARAGFNLGESKLGCQGRVQRVGILDFPDKVPGTHGSIGTGQRQNAPSRGVCPNRPTYVKLVFHRRRNATIDANETSLPNKKEHGPECPAAIIAPPDFKVCPNVRP